MDIKQNEKPTPTLLFYHMYSYELPFFKTESSITRYVIQ